MHPLWFQEDVQSERRDPGGEASPFFWVAKEAQHESYRLSQLDDLFAPFKLAAEMSAGNPPKTGEEWVAAFGRREVAAAFPFSVVESLLNGLRVPFESKTAVLEFHSLEGERESMARGRASALSSSLSSSSSSLRMVSRVRVDFGNGRVTGDLVTECLLVETEELEPSANQERVSTRGDKQGNGSRGAGCSVVCLQSTRFEDTKTILDGVAVPSGRIMAALTSPSPNLRRQRGLGGLPGVPYERLHAGGDLLVARAGSCDETSTLLVYERASATGL